MNLDNRFSHVRLPENKISINQLLNASSIHGIIYCYHPSGILGWFFDLTKYGRYSLPLVLLATF